MKMTHRAFLGAIAAAAMDGMVPQAAQAADILIARPSGTIIIPQSSQQRGRAAHTNIELFRPNNGISPTDSAPGGRFETPASLACLYGMATHTKGCNPTTAVKVATGGSRMIAIVDAYDYPTAFADLNTYSAQYGLPAVTAQTFKVAYGAGTKPAQDSSGGWELEESLDIEMAHALAPNATIVLVEAASNSYPDLLAAETVAARMVSAAGGGEVSNSWGAGESGDEQTGEPYFVARNVVFLASAGDSAGVEQPSILQNVIAVGGTTINRNQAYDYLGQSAWAGTGGGTSAYVPRPAYQAPVKSIVGAYRGAPDIALVADPQSGVWVYDSTPYNGTALNWATIGGTSVAAPASAAIINNAGHFLASSAAELAAIYNGYKVRTNWTDVKTGFCSNNGHTIHASAGWDFCTGAGTPLGRGNK